MSSSTLHAAAPGTRLPAISTSRAMLRSKTGIAILKSLQGGFDDRLLQRRLCRISKDYLTEVRIIERRQKAVEDRAHLIMRRSEKLVETYSLPPIQMNGGRKRSLGEPPHQHQQHAEPGATDISTGGAGVGTHLSPRRSSSLQSTSPRLRRSTEPAALEFRKAREQVHTEDIRQFTLGSPVPPKDIHPHADLNIADNAGKLSRGSSGGGGGGGGDEHVVFPAITIDKCEDSKSSDDMTTLTSIEVTGPSLTTDTVMKKAKSTANIFSSSPVMHRRLTRDVTQGTDKTNKRQFTTLGFKMFKSEGNIPDAIHRQKSVLDPRFIGLESVLQPHYGEKLSPETLTVPSLMTSPPLESPRLHKTGSSDSLEPHRKSAENLHQDRNSSSRNCSAASFTSGSGSSGTSRKPARLVPIQYSGQKLPTNE